MPSSAAWDSSAFGKPVAKRRQVVVAPRALLCWAVVCGYKGGRENVMEGTVSWLCQLESCAAFPRGQVVWDVVPSLWAAGAETSPAGVIYSCPIQAIMIPTSKMQHFVCAPHILYSVFDSLGNQWCTDLPSLSYLCVKCVISFFMHCPLLHGRACFSVTEKFNICLIAYLR